MKTFHWRKIGTSQHLQTLLEILKAAPGPLTGMDIQLAFKDRGKWAVNPGTDMGELGRNPGYATSGGIRFPDGKYRYWLTGAPGWTPRWRVNKQFQVVPYDAPDEGVDLEPAGKARSFEPAYEYPQDSPHACPTCGAETSGGFCSDDHKKAFFSRR